MTAIKNNVTNQPSILETLSTPNFLGEQELNLKNGKLILQDKPVRILPESDKKIIQIAYAFTQRVNKDASQRLVSGEKKSLNIEAIKTNFNAITKHLHGRVNVKELTNHTIMGRHFGASKVKIQELQKEDFQGSFDGLTRRVVRYALYQLHASGYFQSLSSVVSLPTLVRFAFGTIVSGVGTGFGIAQSVAGAGISAGAGTASAISYVAPNVMSYLPVILTALAITEGPGVVGHLTRRMTPNFVKNAYGKVTPSFVQKAVNFVFHTDKFVARKLDTALQGLAILLG